MTKIVIAPSAKEKAETKQFQKKLEVIGSEETKANEDGVKYIPSKRDEDFFLGGPLDGMSTSHQPNGPTLPFDPGRLWADYFIKDHFHIPKAGGKVWGFHVYSSTRALEYEHALSHPDHANVPQLNLGTRTANFRKCYYYIGFIQDELLMHDGIHPHDFAGILTLS